MALAYTIFAFYSPMLILIRTERVVKRSAVRRGPGDNPNFLLADDSAEQLRENIRKPADLICRP